MEDEKSNNFVGVIVVLLLVWGAISLFSKDKDTSYSPMMSSPASVYTGYTNYNENTDTVEEPENPYNDGSGHSAGYNWAEENGVTSCGGNSQSFIDGCQEYLDQEDAYENNN